MTTGPTTKGSAAFGGAKAIAGDQWFVTFVESFVIAFFVPQTPPHNFEEAV